MASFKEWKGRDGRYRCRVHVFLAQDPVTKKQDVRTETLVAASKRAARTEADAWAATQRSQFQQGVLREPCKDTLAVYGRRWLTDVCRERVKRSTWGGYDQTFRAYIEAPPKGLPNLGRVAMEQLRAEHVRSLYTWLRESGRRRGGTDHGPGLGHASIKSVHAVLRQVLRYAYTNDAIPVDLAAKLRDAIPRRGKGEHQAKAFTEEQLARFLAAAEADRYAPLWHLLADTGMRPGEALALTWEDVDLAAATVRIRRTLSWLWGAEAEAAERRWEFTAPKTKNSTRLVTLPQETVAILAAHRQRELKDRGHVGLVFTTQTGQPCDWTNLSGHYASICRRAKLGTFGLPPAPPPEGTPGPRKQPSFTPLLPPYCLRHTHATLMLKAGEPIKVVSERLGHASTAFTMDVYADAIPQMQEQAAASWDKVRAKLRAKVRAS